MLDHLLQIYRNWTQPYYVTYVGSYAANIPQLDPTLLPKYTATRPHPIAKIYRK